MIRLYLYFFYLFIILSIFFFAADAEAGNSATHATVNLIKPYQMQLADEEIAHIYKTVLSRPTLPIQNKVINGSAYFLGRPYYFGGTGEGLTGQFDQNPLYRTDRFDCMTYVEMVLALSQANNLSQFQQTIKKIRYVNGDVSYVKRNHFPSVDWNDNNQRTSYIRDVTADLQIPYKVVMKTINKPAWYRHKTASDLSLLQQPSQREFARKLQAFRNLSRQVSLARATINYIPLSALFSQQGGQIIPRWQFFNRIPAASIIEIVQLDDKTQENTGTMVLITHMGFAIKTSQGLAFREASRVLGKIADVPLPAYLATYWRYGSNNNAVGINIESVQ